MSARVPITQEEADEIISRRLESLEAENKALRGKSDMLLAALKRAQAAFKFEGVFVEEVDAAIAKAEGGAK